MEPRLADAIVDYLHAHIERHGRKRTAEVFGVSRHTLWRFLERSQAGRALPQAVLDRVGESQDAVDAATQALLARPLSPPPAKSSDGLIGVAVSPSLSLFYPPLLLLVTASALVAMR